MRSVSEALALVVLLSLTWLAVRVALAGSSVALVSAGRVAFTVLALWLLARYGPKAATAQGDWCSSSPVGRRDAIVLSVAGVSGYTALSTMAVALGGTVLPALIVSTGPLWVLLLQWLTGAAGPAPAAAVGTAAAVLGTAGYILAGAGGTAPASIGCIVCAVAAVLLMSLYMVRFSQLTRAYHGPMAPVIAPIYAWGLVPLGAWAAWDVVRGERLSATAFLVLAALGLAVYLPVYLIQHHLLAHIGAHTVSLLGLAVTPLVGIETALLALGPWPTAVQWLLITVTVSGMALVISSQHRVSPERPDAPQPPTPPVASDDSRSRSTQ